MKRVDDQERDAIATAIASGMARNDVARKFGRSPGLVSQIAKERQLSFDRSSTKEATAAAMADNAAKLETLKTRWIDEALVALDELHAPAKVVKFYQGDFYEHEVDEPFAADKRNITWRAHSATLAAIRIDEHQGGGVESQAEVDQWLNSMAPED